MLASVCLSQPQTVPPEPANAQEIRTEIALVEALLPKLPDRGAGLYVLAEDYAQLGKVQKATELLRECILLDEGFDPSEDPTLQALHGQADFQALRERALRRYPQVHQAHVAFSVAEKDLIPEGLAVDPSKRVFYLGSLHRRKIVKITESGEVSDFVSADQADWGPLCGIKVDPADQSVWANVCSDFGSGAALLHFGLNGKLIERFPAPDGEKHLFNDLVLRNAREIYLTDSLAHQAYRFDRQSHAFTALSFPRAMYYPNGIALSDDGQWLYVADAFGVFQVDLSNRLAREIDPGRAHTLAAVDGLYWYKGGLLAVQNGIGLPRLARMRLSDDGWHLKNIELLEYRSPLVKLPTTGAILDSKFYFISNSQVDNLKDEKIVDAAKLQPVHISVVPLR